MVTAVRGEISSFSQIVVLISSSPNSPQHSCKVIAVNGNELPFGASVVEPEDSHGECTKDGVLFWEEL